MLWQNSMNLDKTEYLTKQHKLNTCRDILHITHMSDEEKYQISPHMSYGQIWNTRTWQMWRFFRFLHICHVQGSDNSPHDTFFSAYLISDIGDKYQVCICHMNQLLPIKLSLIQYSVCCGPFQIRYCEATFSQIAG